MFANKCDWISNEGSFVVHAIQFVSPFDAFHRHALKSRKEGNDGVLGEFLSVGLGCWYARIIVVDAGHISKSIRQTEQLYIRRPDSQQVSK